MPVNALYAMAQWTGPESISSTLERQQIAPHAMMRRTPTAGKHVVLATTPPAGKTMQCSTISAIAQYAIGRPRATTRPHARHATLQAVGATPLTATPGTRPARSATQSPVITIRALVSPVTTPRTGHLSHSITSGFPLAANATPLQAGTMLEIATSATTLPVGHSQPLTTPVTLLARPVTTHPLTIIPATVCCATTPPLGPCHIRINPTTHAVIVMLRLPAIGLDNAQSVTTRARG